MTAAAIAIAFATLPRAATVPPIVFVSRQINDRGSVFHPTARAMPGVGPHSRFRPAAPGTLLVRNADGSIRVLVDGTRPTAASLNLSDVNAPSVSYDGRSIVFAGLPAPQPGRSYPSAPGAAVGAWRLYIIGADGTGLRRVPIDEPAISMGAFVAGASGSWSADDTYPCWLPDGRIVFSSTRWPSYGQYSGMVGTNLFVVHPDGTGLHRITAERSGADRPLVDPLTGRIVFSRWWRNYRFPTDRLDTLRTTDGTARALGLTTQFDPDLPSRTPEFDGNSWTLASINPDGTDLRAFALHFRGNEGANHAYGGAFAPDGTLYANYFPMENMTEASGFGGVRRVRRGALLYEHVVGNTRRYEHPQVSPTSFGVEQSPTGYAADPAVVDQATLVVSLATANRLALLGSDVAQDYGLYAIDPTGRTRPTLLYDNPGTAEVQAQVLEPRPSPPVVADTVTSTPAALPPPATGPFDRDGTFAFHALNVYANGPVDMDIVNAPAVGSAATIRFFLDHQRSSLASRPDQDFPILLEERRVASDGSVIAPRSPANLPLFEQLRDANARVPPTTRGVNVDGGAHVAGLNYGRPGTVVRCVGCHAGHTLISVPARDADARFSNLAPGATASASSQLDDQASPQYVADRRVRKATRHWSTAAGAVTGQWVALTFPVDVVVRTVRLYGRAGACAAPTATVRLFSDPSSNADGARATSGTPSPGGLDVAFSDVRSRVVRVELGDPGSTCRAGSSLSLAEVEVIAAGAPALPVAPARRGRQSGPGAR